MKQAEKPESRGTDKVLLVIVFLLVIIGLIILYSTSSYNGQIKFGDPFYYLKKQIFATSLGLAGMYAVARTDYHIWEKLAVPGYLMAIVLCIAVMLFGDEYNGSKRWLSLGPFSFQPSEYVKVALIVFLAWLVKAYHIIQDHAVCPSCCRTCGGQQLKHGGDYSWHCRDPDLYRQSEICPVHMDGGDRDWIHGYLSWTGELPFGAYRHLAESGEI